MSAQERQLIALLEAKYREDPKGFREFLPGAVELLPGAAPKREGSKSPFGLTAHEVAFHRAGLSESLDKLAERALTPDEAARGLQHCANLIRDDSLDKAVGYETVKALVTAAIGKSPGSIKANTTAPVAGGRDGKVVEQVSAIRGVYLDIDREGRLVSITINPRQVAERRRIMKFVGAGWDPNPNVAARHDDYLAMQALHGRD